MMLSTNEHNDQVNRVSSDIALLEATECLRVGSIIRMSCKLFQVPEVTGQVRAKFP